MMGARTNVHDRSVSICRAIPQINISTLQVLIPPTNEFLVASYAPQVSSSTLPGGSDLVPVSPTNILVLCQNTLRERGETIAKYFLYLACVSYEYPRPVPERPQRKGGKLSQNIFYISSFTRFVMSYARNTFRGKGRIPCKTQNNIERHDDKTTKSHMIHNARIYECIYRPYLTTVGGGKGKKTMFTMVQNANNCGGREGRSCDGLHPLKGGGERRPLSCVDTPEREELEGSK